jgi:hypothetical protein
VNSTRCVARGGVARGCRAEWQLQQRPQQCSRKAVICQVWGARARSGVLGREAVAEYEGTRDKGHSNGSNSSSNWE